MKAKKQKISFDLLLFLSFLIFGLVLIIIFEKKVDEFIKYKNSQIKPKTISQNLSINTAENNYLNTNNIEVKIDDTSITPNEIRVKKDSKVIFNIKVLEGYHNIIIDKYGFKSKRIPTNKSAILTFVASQSGVFKVYSKTGLNVNEPKETVLIVE